MNCIIVEDERHAVKHLENQIAATGHPVNVLERLGSVTKAVEWLRQNQADLIFLDVELVDGLSFEIFDHVEIKTPVIFTTSYEQYLIKAFEVNSISYLLKPVKMENLRSALTKFRTLYEEPQAIRNKIFTVNHDYQRRFLIQSGNTMVIVHADDIAWFNIENSRFIILTTREKQQYVLESSTLDVLEQRLDPAKFFRINRQYIINIDAIQTMHRMEKGRIRIDTLPSSKEDLVVSAEKATEFRNWLNR